MAMQDEIRELTVNLLQSTVDASLVTAVCVGTEQFLTRRLRRELTPADCHDVFVLAAAYFDLRAFIALLRHEKRICKVKLVYVWVFVACLLDFGAVRNILLVRFGIDPLGDNRAFWGWS